MGANGKKFTIRLPDADRAALAQSLKPFMSPRGFFLKTLEPVLPGARVTIQVEHHDGSLLLSGEGWVETAHPGGLALDLVWHDPEAVERILRLPTLPPMPASRLPTASVAPLAASPDAEPRSPRTRDPSNWVSALTREAATAFDENEITAADTEQTAAEPVRPLADSFPGEASAPTDQGSPSSTARDLRSEPAAASVVVPPRTASAGLDSGAKADQTLDDAVPSVSTEAALSDWEVKAAFETLAWPQRDRFGETAAPRPASSAPLPDEELPTPTGFWRPESSFAALLSASELGLSLPASLGTGEPAAATERPEVEQGAAPRVFETTAALAAALAADLCDSLPPSAETPVTFAVELEPRFLRALADRVPTSQSGETQGTFGISSSAADQVITRPPHFEEDTDALPRGSAPLPVVQGVAPRVSAPVVQAAHLGPVAERLAAEPVPVGPPEPAIPAGSRAAVRSPERDEDVPRWLSPNFGRHLSEPVLGLDLGSSAFTLAIVEDNGGEVRTLGAEGATHHPTWVALDGSGAFVTAPDVSGRHEGRLWLDPARWLGSGAASRIFESDRELGFALGTGEAGEIVLAGATGPVAIERALAHRLAEARMSAERVLERALRRAVIVVPTYAHPIRKSALRALAERAGFNVEAALSASLAAVLGHLERGSGRRRILLYELGSGGFVASLIEVDGERLDVRGAIQEPRAAGFEMDARIARLLFETVRRAHGETTCDHRFLIAARLAKEELSRAPQAMARISDLNYSDRRLTISVPITRVAYSAEVSDLIDRSVDAVRQLLTELSLDEGALDDFWLLGRSTQMPEIQRKLKAAFGRPLTRVPETAPAAGAARYAELAEAGEAPWCREVSNGTLSHLEPSGRLSPIFPRQTKLPARRSVRVFGPGPAMFFFGDEDRAASEPLFQAEGGPFDLELRLGADGALSFGPLPAGARITLVSSLPETPASLSRIERLGESPASSGEAGRISRWFRKALGRAEN